MLTTSISTNHERIFKILLIKIKNFKIKFQNQRNFYIITLRGNVFYAPLHRTYITDTIIYVYTTIFNGIN